MKHRDSDSPSLASPDGIPTRGLGLWLRRLADWVHAAPWAWILPQLLLFTLAVWYTVQNLQFDTDRNDLVNNNRQDRREYLRFLEEFNAGDELVALVESEDVEKNRQFVERLGRRLEQETNLFQDVFYKGDLSMMGPKALLFVTNETVLREMAQRLEEARPVLTRFAAVTNLNSTLHLVLDAFRSGKEESVDAAFVDGLPALTRIVDQAADALARPGLPPSPGVAALFDGSEEAEQNLYITFATNRIYLVTARALDPKLNEQAVERFRELIREVQAQVPGVNAGLTGEPVLEVDEMQQARRDMTRATILALVLCGLLLMYSYREVGRPLKAILSLIVGLGYTLGFTTLAIGHLNILTLTFLPILVGLAIDFGIHLVTRFEEELHWGRSSLEALEIALSRTGQGVLTGAFTTAGAFFAMGLTDFKGIREMGVICGSGLLISLIPMTTFLPALLSLGKRESRRKLRRRYSHHRARIEQLWLQRPGWVLLLGVGATILAAAQIRKVRFDYNLLHLQSRGLSSVFYEHKLMETDMRSVLFGAVMVNSLQEAAEMEEKISRLPSVAGVESMTPYLTGNQTNKLRLIRQVKSKLHGLKLPEPDLAPVNVSELHQTVRRLDAYLGLALDMIPPKEEPELRAKLLALRQAVRRLRARLVETDHQEAQKKLTAFQRALFKELRGTFDAIRNQDDSSPLKVKDIPTPLRHRFVSRDGKTFLLHITSKLNLWERKNQEQFLAELRSVSPSVTGTPVQLFEYTTQLKQSYQQAAYYAAAAIALLVFIHFRSLSCVFLALTPVGLGMIWMAGWMGWSGLPFNPANIMTLPLVIGVGVTNGIHILHRCTEECNPGVLARSTGKAVLVSALTTILGFGSLMIARHRGIASLGELMAVGTATCMIAGLTLLPALLTWLQRRGWYLPGTRARLIHNQRARTAPPVSPPKEKAAAPAPTQK